MYPKDTVKSLRRRDSQFVVVVIVIYEGVTANYLLLLLLFVRHVPLTLKVYEGVTANFFKCSMKTCRDTSSVKTGAPLSPLIKQKRLSQNESMLLSQESVVKKQKQYRQSGLDCDVRG